MRILIVVLHGRLIGGLERYGRDLALALRRIGHEVEVAAALEAPQRFEGWGDITPLGLAPARQPARHFYLRAWPRRLCRYLQRVGRRYDLVVAAHAYAAIAASRACVPRYWVWTYGREVWGEWSADLSAGLADAERIVAIAAHTRKVVLARLPGRTVEVVYPGVDTARFVPADALSSPGPAPLRLLTVARLASGQPSKGHDLVIRSLTAIQARIDRPVEYWIVGAGHDRPRLEALTASSGARDSVRFLGLVPEAELPSAYQRATVFVMPSASEGFGIAYLEAAACEKPVVGSTAGGAPEALADGVTGYCVDPAAGGALTDCVVRLLRDPALAAALGRAGRQRVEREFSMQAFEARLAALLPGASGGGVAPLAG
jgi:glycosyltransferase involved in cell wall biosynthesis